MKIIDIIKKIYNKLFRKKTRGIVLDSTGKNLIYGCKLGYRFSPKSIFGLWKST